MQLTTRWIEFCGYPDIDQHAMKEWEIKKISTEECAEKISRNNYIVPTLTNGEMTQMAHNLGYWREGLPFEIKYAIQEYRATYGG